MLIVLLLLVLIHLRFLLLFACLFCSKYVFNLSYCFCCCWSCSGHTVDTAFTVVNGNHGQELQREPQAIDTSIIHWKVLLTLPVSYPLDWTHMLSHNIVHICGSRWNISVWNCLIKNTHMDELVSVIYIVSKGEFIISIFLII